MQVSISRCIALTINREVHSCLLVLFGCEALHISYCLSIGFRKKMPKIVLHNSAISGLHSTKTSSHPDITLLIDADITHKDPNAMKVVVPMLQNLPPESLEMVTWPRNPESKRLVDQVVRDVAGKKVGNAPANLCGVFKDLL